MTGVSRKTCRPSLSRKVSVGQHQSREDEFRLSHFQNTTCETISAIRVVGPKRATTPASRSRQGRDARVIEGGLPGPGTTRCRQPLTSRNGSMTFRCAIRRTDRIPGSPLGWVTGCRKIAGVKKGGFELDGDPRAPHRAAILPHQPCVMVGGLQAPSRLDGSRVAPTEVTLRVLPPSSLLKAVDPCEPVIRVPPHAYHRAPDEQGHDAHKQHVRADAKARQPHDRHPP
jgi:hypothetical protein